MTFGSVEELLADARSRLRRLSAAAAAREVAARRAALVDIRPAWQRVQQGEIADAYVVERNHLEWRLHPSSAARLAAARAGRTWIVICQQGYASSLAADSLNAIGVRATDVIDGFDGWVAAGLPTVPARPTPPDSVVPG